MLQSHLDKYTNPALATQERLNNIYQRGAPENSPVSSEHSPQRYGGDRGDWLQPLVFAIPTGPFFPWSFRRSFNVPGHHT